MELARQWACAHELRPTATRPGLQAEAGGYESLFVRKAPHVFGWDIMPRALSAGIWRAVRLRYLAPERIRSLWLDTEHIEADGSPRPSPCITRWYWISTLRDRWSWC